MSVINQTFKDWELLLINDGSNDGSVEIAKYWKGKDKRIKLFNHKENKNKGVSSSRNLGIKNAKGIWIAFLDADDIWLKNKLECQYESIINCDDHNMVLNYCRAKVIDENGDLIVHKQYARSYNPLYSYYGKGIVGLKKDAFKWAIKGGFDAPTSTVICKRELIVELGGFEEDMHFSEDALMWYRLIAKGNIYFINTPLSLYRVHKDQWNAAATNKLKIKRRFIGYERLLEISDNYQRGYISYLLVNKGFRILTRSNIGLPYFDLNQVKEYWLRLIRNPKILTKHKLMSLIVIISEIMILPTRILSKWINI